MKFHRSILTGAALALALAPIVAQAQQSSGAASKLSLVRAVPAGQVKRSATPMVRANRLDSTGYYVVGAIALGLLVWGVIR